MRKDLITFVKWLLGLSTILILPTIVFFGDDKEMLVGGSSIVVFISFIVSFTKENDGTK
jgi:hypothetical protein